MGTTVYAPGKLILAGEWAILEPHNKGIVMAIAGGITARIAPAAHYRFTSPTINLYDALGTFTNQHLTLTPSISAAHFIHRAAEITLQYLTSLGIPLHPFSLVLDSPSYPHFSSQKIGFGSSASCVVAVVRAILAHHEHHAHNHLLIFKLAYLAHYKEQQHMGSGMDIAAATWGQTLIYQRPDPVWLTSQISTEQSLDTLINQPWPLLYVEPFTLPANLHIIAGFVGTSAHTPTLITHVNTFKRNNPTYYLSLCQENAVSVEQLIKGIQHNNYAEIHHAITHQRETLKKLSDACSGVLEIPALTHLIELATTYGAAAKFSGAGGGDCGIAVSNDLAITDALSHAWYHAHISPVPCTIIRI